MTGETANSGPILFYDGECGLCDRTVRWCLDHDKRRVLRFAPLQGSTYAALAIPEKPAALDTLVLLDQQGLHVRSDAVLRILRHIGGFWAWLGAAGRLMPRPVRDSVYRFIAARRLGWFGGLDACRLPSRDDRSCLLP